MEGHIVNLEQTSAEKEIERITSAAPAVRSQTAAAELQRAITEVQAAVVVAQQRPRNPFDAWAEMKSACERLSLANRAFYKINNRGTGPSVHLARELARIWGNIDFGVKELSRNDEVGQSEVLAYAWDQQANVRSTRSLIVPHARMAQKVRQPLVDLGDIYLNNQNIGARAVRECLFTVMPADYTSTAQDICRNTLEKGDGVPLDERIKNMIEKFAKLDIKLPRIEARQGRKRTQWTPSDLADLAVIYSSLTRGEIKADDEFPPSGPTIEDLKA